MSHPLMNYPSGQARPFSVPENTWVVTLVRGPSRDGDEAFIGAWPYRELCALEPATLHHRGNWTALVSMTWTSGGPYSGPVGDRSVRFALIGDSHCSPCTLLARGRLLMPDRMAPFANFQLDRHAQELLRAAAALRGES